MDIKRVLVVDDQRSDLEWASHAVKSCGLEPVQADGFDSATKLLEQEPFALVVTDNYMPHANAGIELIQYMSRRLKYRAPTILHTSTPPRDLKIIQEVFPWVEFVQKSAYRESDALMASIKRLLS